jgi:hypothetical protein
MIPVSSAISGGLVWSRNSNGYELKFNDEVVGSLRKTSFWSSDYRAETSYGTWRLLRSGTLGSGAEIRDENNVSVATFKPSWGGPGTLTFADGQALQIVSEGCWSPVLKVTTADGQPALRVSSREKTVAIETPSALPESRWLLLILFAFYRMRQTEEEGAMAALVAAIG